MAKLYGRLIADRGESTRCSSQGIRSTVETWGSIVSASMTAAGACQVEITDKHGNNRHILWSGNADEEAQRAQLVEWEIVCSRATDDTEVYVFGGYKSEDDCLRAVEQMPAELRDDWYISWHQRLEGWTMQKVLTDASTGVCEECRNRFPKHMLVRCPTCNRLLCQGDYGEGRDPDLHGCVKCQPDVTTSGGGDEQYDPDPEAFV